MRSDDSGRGERTRPGFLVCVRQSSVRGCRFSFVFVYFIIKMCEMFAGSRLLLPVLTNFVTLTKVFLVKNMGWSSKI